MWTINARRGAVVGLAVLALVVAAWAVIAGQAGDGGTVPGPLPSDVSLNGEGSLGSHDPPTGGAAGAVPGGVSDPRADREDPNRSPDVSNAAGATGAGTWGVEGGPDSTLPAVSDPDAALTWEALYSLLRSELGTAPGVRDSDLATFLDAGAQRTDVVSRAELAAAVVQALGLDDAAAVQGPENSLFQDVSPLHRAFGAVALAHRLGLVPHRPGDLFRPEQVVTVAEAREVVAAARTLEIRTGQAKEINEPASSLTLVGDDGATAGYILGPDTLVVRNGEPSAAGQLLPEDELRVVADQSGLLRVVVAEGNELTQSQRTMAVVTALLQELLTPEQTAAILDRDWERAGNELKVNLYNQLLEHGLTPEEAAAVLDQDWSAVTEHGKARLAEIVGTRLSVAPEMVLAVLDEDWETARSYAEVEVLEYLLNELMEAANA